MSKQPVQHFLIGQRVIVGDEIGRIVRPTETQARARYDGHWVETTRGASYYDDRNVHPLPRGQL